MSEKPCRQCSECDGTHHWLDNPDALTEADPYSVCKHCDAVADECEDCDDGEVDGGGICGHCRGTGRLVRS